MNQAIKSLERVTVEQSGPDADRFLDDIGNLVNSTEGISSKRDVSSTFVSKILSSIVKIIFYR